MLHLKCLQQLRRQLREGSAAELHAVLHGQPCKAIQLRNFPAELTLPDMLQRDVLAMALCRLAVLQEGEVYGGFVRDMLAGTHWHDVDLCFLHPRSITKFKQTLPAYLELLLGLPLHTVKLTLLNKHDHYPLKVHHHELRWQTVVIPVDISYRSHAAGLRLPATLGSGLVWTHKGFGWRSLECDPDTPLMSVEAMRDLLHHTHDVLRRPSFGEWELMAEHQREEAEAYYTAKKEQLEQRGFTFVAESGISLAEFRAATTHD